MAELHDMIVPMLQRMQGDISELKLKVDVIDGRTSRVETKIDNLENLVTYSLGLTSRARADIDQLKKRVDAIERASPNS